MPSTEIYSHFQKLSEQLEKTFVTKFTIETTYESHITAAFSKCFEFNILVNKKTNTKDSFFYTASLRGICEDLIVLKFVKLKNIDKSAFLRSYAFIRVSEMIRAQESFFKKNNPNQIVFTFPDFDTKYKQHLNPLKETLKLLGMNKERSFPSTSFMATESGLIELYNYLYAATSEMVHFSPQNLMRMGWGSLKYPDIAKFSTKSFWKYYMKFNRFYAAYLFILFSHSFKKELKLTKETLNTIKLLESDLILESRWPELVTFEEMNHPEAENFRLTNLLRKVKSLAKEANLPEAEEKKLIAMTLVKISDTKKKQTRKKTGR